jgi:hypothetical protein
MFLKYSRLFFVLTILFLFQTSAFADIIIYHNGKYFRPCNGSFVHVFPVNPADIPANAPRKWVASSWMSGGGYWEIHVPDPVHPQSGPNQAELERQRAAALEAHRIELARQAEITRQNEIKRLHEVGRLEEATNKVKFAEEQSKIFAETQANLANLDVARDKTFKQIIEDRKAKSAQLKDWADTLVQNCNNLALLGTVGMVAEEGATLLAESALALTPVGEAALVIGGIGYVGHQIYEHFNPPPTVAQDGADGTLAGIEPPILGDTSTNTPTVGPVLPANTLNNPIEDLLGEGATVKTNKHGDKVFISKDGKTKVRFDINESHGDEPHMHVEKQSSTGKWKDKFHQHRFYTGKT